jgi:hypothetical protein
MAKHSSNARPKIDKVMNMLPLATNVTGWSLVEWNEV